MVKVRNTWNRQGNTSSSTSYLDPTVDYDDPSTPFGSSQTTESIIKNRNSWSKRSKVRSFFQRNAASIINQIIYNSHNLYNAHLTYDSIVVGEPMSTTKKPVEWSKV